MQSLRIPQALHVASALGCSNKARTSGSANPQKCSGFFFYFLRLELFLFASHEGWHPTLKALSATLT